MNADTSWGSLQKTVFTLDTPETGWRFRPISFQRLDYRGNLLNVTIISHE